MPPRAILSSVWRTMWSAWASPVRACWRRRTRRSIGWGNLGAWPNPPCVGSKRRARLRAAPSRSLTPSSPFAGRDGPHRAEVLGHLARRGDDLVAPLLPGVVDALQDAREAGHPARVGRGKVRPAVEGLEVGGEEDRHRPAAVPGHRLHGRHVDLVEVGPLLAVDLDVDEVLVHQGGDGRVLEALALHDVAPVAGRVADREEDRLVLGLRPGERLGAPGIPVDRVVRVLEQVRAGLAGQAVGGMFGAGVGHGSRSRRRGRADAVVRMRTRSRRILASNRRARSWRAASPEVGRIAQSLPC